jgi:hypothetical protein
MDAQRILPSRCSRKEGRRFLPRLGERSGSSTTGRSLGDGFERSRRSGSVSGVHDGRLADDLGAFYFRSPSFLAVLTSYYSDRSRRTRRTLDYLIRWRRRSGCDRMLPFSRALLLFSLNCSTHRVGSALKQGITTLPLAEVVLSDAEIAQQCALCETFESTETNNRFKRCSSCKRRFYVRSFT